MDDNFDEVQELETPESVESVPEEIPVEEPAGTQQQPIKNTVNNIRNNSNKSSKESKLDKIAKSEKNLANTEKAASKASKAASNATKAASKGMKAASKGIEAGSNAAAGALSAIPVVGGALGAGVKGVGEATSKTADAAANTLDAASKVSDKASKKLAESSKKHAKNAKNAKDAKDASKKIKDTAKKTVENVKKVVEALKNPVKRWIIIGAVCLLVLIIILAAILEPLTDAMNKIKSGADYVEKLNNLIHGLGFENSKDAFYDELDFLSKHYDDAIDDPTLMATLFYDDVFGANNVEDSEYGLDGNEKEALATVMMGVIDYAAKEAFTEEDANGIVYSANKIYRLKRLTKHMTQKDGSSLVTVPLDDYMDLSEEQIAAGGKAFGKSLIAAMCARLLVTLDITNTLSQTLFGKIMNPYYSSTMEYLTTSGYATNHDGFDAITNSVYNFDMLFEELVTTITDIEGISLVVTIYGQTYTFSFGQTGEAYVNDTSEMVSFEESGEDVGNIDISIMVTYSKYELDEDGYFEYLKNEYIPNMPEFQSIIRDKDNNIIDSKVDGIIEDIKMLAATWEEIYGNPNGTGESDVCIGNIHPNLLDQFTTPVELTVGAEVNFSTTTAFGVTKNGKMHYGVDLNEESVGVGVGTPVRAIYAGNIVESTASEDFIDFDPGSGGCIKINHNMTYDNDDGESTSVVLDSYYCGLDPTSMSTMTTGTQVTAGAQIGTIGDATYSEDGKTPGLHFAIYSEGKNSYMNPINVFITCNYDYVEGGICTYDKNGSLVIEFPDTVLAYPQKNYVVECYSAEYGYGCYNNVKSWAYNQAVVWKKWVAMGARYKNGIAVMKIDNVDRYLVAVTQKMGQVGDIITATLENGETIPLLIADIKSYGDTGVTNAKQCSIPLINDPGCYGHFDGTISVLEFDVDPVQYRRSSNPAGWGQEWDVTQKVVSITNKGSILGNTSDYGSICQNTDPDSPSPGVNPGKPENIGGGFAPNQPTILNEPLDEFLLSKGSSIEKYNFEIMKAKNEVGGNCTRKGAVALTIKTLNFISAMGVKLPYWFGGGHSDYGNNDDLKYTQSKWGSSRCSTVHGSNICGLDCTGFVRWILVTAGYNRGSFCVGASCGGLVNNQTSVSNYFPGATYAGPLSTLSEAGRLVPGDIIFSSGHIMYVVGVDSTGYTVAEAQQTSVGIVYTKVGFNSSSRYGIYMTNYYSNPANCAN